MSHKIFLIPESSRFSRWLRNLLSSIFQHLRRLFALKRKIRSRRSGFIICVQLQMRVDCSCFICICFDICINYVYSNCTFFDYRMLMLAINPANTMDTIDTSLIRMLIDGPDVSLNGSPIVSPTTAALWLSLPLPPK